MKQALFVVAAALALSACVSHNFSEGARVNYRCDGEREFSTRRVEPAIEVYAGGATLRLEPAGDGQFRSEDGSVTFDVNTGTLTGIYQGPYQNCRRQMRWSRFY
jgi:hypothetical protein